MPQILLHILWDKAAKIQNLDLLQAKLQEKMEYVDLAPSSSSGSAPALRLTRLDRYLHGPTVVTTAQYHTNDDVLRASRTVVQEMLSWQPQLTQVQCGIADTGSAWGVCSH